MNTIITSKTTVQKSEFPFEENSDNGINYLWQLLNPEVLCSGLLDYSVLKDGFAKRTYTGDKAGVESRIKNTLYDMERKAGINRGVLKAKIIMTKAGDYDTTLSAEQYFHSKNKASKIQPILQAIAKDCWTIGIDKKTLLPKVQVDYRKTIGGSSEFFVMPVNRAKARFANAWRKCNLAIGLEIVNWKRNKGMYGCPVGGSGQGDEEPNIATQARRARA